MPVGRRKWFIERQITGYLAPRGSNSSTFSAHAEKHNFVGPTFFSCPFSFSSIFPPSPPSFLFLSLFSFLFLVRSSRTRRPKEASFVLVSGAYHHGPIKSITRPCLVRVTMIRVTLFRKHLFIRACHQNSLKACRCISSWHCREAASKE